MQPWSRDFTTSDVHPTKIVAWIRLPGLHRPKPFLGSFGAYRLQYDEGLPSILVALVMIRKNVSVAKEPTASSGSGELRREVIITLHNLFR